MKLVVVVVDRERTGEITALFDGGGVTGYSLLPDVLGRGETGAHLGTRAFPGENAMVLALVPAEQAAGLTEQIRELKRSFRATQGLMAFTLDAVPLV
jgi:Nitrogen regulatory protein P-II